MSKKAHQHNHPDHFGELPRLNRVAGQIDGIKRMIGEDRHCTEILAQIRAARAALKTVEASVLESHLQSCVRDAMTSGDQAEIDAKIEELKDLFKRFD
ncbi:MAG: metal-sensitive transcriptional regulator [Alphaproteobacteria bacterium]|nr:metal-sensitive transcriptional regulator [Alphaproteobacteria bacterium]